MKFYLDSSILVDFLIGEPVARAVISQLHGELFSSKLGRAETIRTLQKTRPQILESAFEFLDGVNCLEISDEVLSLVENYGAEITVKTADAIHLATASLILDEEDYLVTLDKQMQVNAERVKVNLFTSS